MSTFGEIVEPASRAAWEDWDEITPERNVPELKWQRKLEDVDAIDTFLILEGKYITDYFKLQNCNLELVNSISDVQLQLFRSKVANMYICVIKNYNLLQSSEIVELLKQYLTVSSNVIALQTKALAEYHAVELQSQDCVIRAVYTTNNMPVNLKISKLEQPNIISGVTAGVISLREHLNVAGVAIVCYMEHPEEYQIEELEKLLEKLNISHHSKHRPSSILNSNLYI